MKCPYCDCDKLYVRRRGFNWTIGCIGAILVPGGGFLLGLIGSDKDIWGCKSCGKEWST